ncbi:hypothetical protein BJ170DRAFT_256725 [Xylariales sp. AK1849]|nr:hypothetical protein BJ170DRAFT_256725 [Xylariales sp. AK1849]
MASTARNCLKVDNSLTARLYEAPFPLIMVMLSIPRNDPVHLSIPTDPDRVYHLWKPNNGRMYMHGHSIAKRVVACPGYQPATVPTQPVCQLRSSPHCSSLSPLPSPAHSGATDVPLTLRAAHSDTNTSSSTTSPPNQSSSNDGLKVQLPSFESRKRGHGVYKAAQPLRTLLASILFLFLHPPANQTLHRLQHNVLKSQQPPLFASLTDNHGLQLQHLRILRVPERRHLQV